MIGATDIDRRYEYVTQEHLNQDELRVMEKFRELDYGAQKTIESVIDIALTGGKPLPELSEESQDN